MAVRPSASITMLAETEKTVKDAKVLKGEKLMEDVMFGMTEVGKARYDLVSKYNLEEFYQVQNGSVIIPKDMFKEPISRFVLIFLKDNPNWVLGHTTTRTEAYWYLATLADLREV